MREDSTASNNHIIFYDGSLVTHPSVELFSVDHNKSVGQSQAGRGTVHFIDRGKQRWVLKHYHRGGVLAKLLKSNYLYLGVTRTRMVREFRLLQWMTAAGLPVPRPVAALVTKQGFVYQGSIISECLPASFTLAETITRESLNMASWQAVGSCIARFHNHGIYHADLNANNIMINAGTVYLIDFDKSYRKATPAGSWAQQNLARLKRSLDKIHKLRPDLYFDEGAWQSLTLAYQSARTH